MLTYDYVEDIVERRAPFRAAHLALARDAHERGALLMAGALSDPVDGALFVFFAPEPSEVADFVSRDPYVQAGLVTDWSVRPWTVVIGTEEPP